ncbi:MAG TPA: DUF4410 domain-containing protein [Dongiaceae bacterium]|nr:DUF4410 domain-containing protein [Dongiaceae bacterium]
MRSVVCALRLSLALGLAGCSHATVETQPLYLGAALPRPAVVLVRDFVVAPGDVALDSGRIARLRRAIGGESDSQQQQAAAQSVVDALGNTLVDAIARMGLTARRISADTVVPAGDNAVLVDGNIVAINEGNRAKRVVIGFGAGASTVDVRVALTYLAAARAEQRLAGFQASGSSGAAPGMLATGGAGAAVGAASTATTVAVSGGTQAIRETQGTTVSHDADNIGDKIAAALKPIFIKQGWIAAN